MLIKRAKIVEEAPRAPGHGLSPTLPGRKFQQRLARRLPAVLLRQILIKDAEQVAAEPEAVPASRIERPPGAIYASRSLESELGVFPGEVDAGTDEEGGAEPGSP